MTTEKLGFNLKHIERIDHREAAAMAKALVGVLDIHAHAHPDKTHRSIDVLELAKMYKDRGFRGFVIMNHHDPTAGLAYLARKHAPGLEVFGGLVLNRLVGGMNRNAVEHFIRVEGGYGRIVYMPTTDSEYEVVHRRTAPEPFVRISENGRLLPEVEKMLDLIAKYGLVLSTGHSSPAEVLMLIREAKARKVESVLASNPMWLGMNVEQMVEAGRLGAYVEFIYFGLRDAGANLTIKDYAEAIRAIGPEHCILSSCGGQEWMPIHTHAWKELFSGLTEHGFSADDLDLMAKTNPAVLLGLKPRAKGTQAD